VARCDSVGTSHPRVDGLHGRDAKGAAATLGSAVGTAGGIAAPPMLAMAARRLPLLLLALMARGAGGFMANESLIADRSMDME